MRPILLFAPILMLVAVPAVATHYHLKADGSGDYPTIKAAIAAASTGDTILCADGTYGGSGSSGLDFAGKNLVLRSESNHPKDCVIHPQSDRAFYFHSGETASAIVQGFTIQYGGEALGGGAYVTNASPTFFNCVVRECQASDGGAFYLEGASANPSILNCALVQNQATNRGGAIFFHYAHGIVRNCTLAYNEAMDADGGGGVYDSYSSPTVSNCVIWGNWNQQVHGLLTGYSWSLIEGWTSGGTNNFAGNPSFVTGAGGAFYLLAGTSDGEDAGGALASATCFTTADGSQCMDRWTTRTDQRDDGGTLDVGYHYPHYAASIPVPSYKPTIQAAIDAAWNGDVVLVADGTYTGDGNRDLVTRGKRVTVRSQSGNAANCTIDCQGASGTPHRGFYIHEGEGPQTVIEDLRIINGWVASSGAGINVTNANPTMRDCILHANHAGDTGGGLFLYQSSATVTGCTFTNNTADNAGGGVLSQSCSPVVTSCLFQSNSATWGGGGMHNYQASPTLTDCVFRYNTCTNWGGGLHCDGASTTPQLVRCRFDENFAKEGAGLYCRNGTHATLTDCEFYTNYTATAGRGGGIYSIGSVLTLMRCTFGGNEATVDGGGLYCRSNSSATIDSCVFNNNTTSSGGGGIYFYDHDSSALTNCTFYENETPNGGGLWTWMNCMTTLTRCLFWGNRASTAGVSIGINGACLLTVSCCDVQSGQPGVYVGGGSTLTWGAGNFDANPLLCLSGPSPYGLDASSPCAPAHSGGCGLVGAKPVACSTTDAGPSVFVADRLRGSFPNPFALRTRVAFELRARTEVSLEVYDVSGRLVKVLARGDYDPGPHEVTWDGRDGGGRTVARGAYFCRLRTATAEDVVRMEVVR